VGIVRHMHLDYIVTSLVEQPSARVLFFAARLLSRSFAIVVPSLSGSVLSLCFPA
jgi:hypothetical protein